MKTEFDIAKDLKHQNIIQYMHFNIN